MTEQTKPAAKHIVKTSKVYASIGDMAVNTYVTLGSERVYVQAKEGAELTSSQARRLATPPQTKTDDTEK